MSEPINSGRFGAGNSGKPAGAVSKTTKALKEAILLAAEQVGSDGKGKDGLTGYLRHVAESDVKAFAGLLGKVLPLQLTGAGGGPLTFQRIERVIIDPPQEQLPK